jgi:hypothetical protein
VRRRNRRRRTDSVSHCPSASLERIPLKDHCKQHIYSRRELLRYSRRGFIKHHREIAITFFKLMLRASNISYETEPFPYSGTTFLPCRESLRRIPAMRHKCRIEESRNTTHTHKIFLHKKSKQLVRRHAAPLKVTVSLGLYRWRSSMMYQAYCS